MARPVPLSDAERSQYAWQLAVEGLGEEGQARLKGATVLVSRVGGVGGTVAMHLAAAGVGRLILAHAGDLRADDLNRQTLMSHPRIGISRARQAAERLQDLNPRVEVVAVEDNVSELNIAMLVEQTDVIASCAPLFQERLLLNRAAVARRMPLVDCAMFELEGQLTTVLPGKTACLACLYPTEPTAWNRRFPVLGAVAATIGCLGALEIIKIISGLDEPLDNQMLLCDLRHLAFRKVNVGRDRACPVCGEVR
ncbi:MAG: HesA/MoeB/ThiF family protein [Planctomycetes bacterium]|nr:HesA/MoeB/ThiF family protein [Planctomycetota bacterium]